MFGRTGLVELPEADKLGDRHLHGILNTREFAVQEKTRTGTVQVLTDHSYISTLAGQHLLFMLIDLLSRQFGVVDCINIVVPNVQTCDMYVSMGKRLPEAVTFAVESVSKGRIESALISSDDADATVAIGFSCTAKGDEIVHGWADGWNVYVGTAPKDTMAFTGSYNPLGPYFAACVLAAEVFKRIGRMNPQYGAFAESLYYSLWSEQRYDSWDEMPSGLEVNGLQLPDLTIVGLGAVGQAVALALGMLPDIVWRRVVLIDKETYDITNHNRCVLADALDVVEETPKVDVVKRFFDLRGIKAYGFEGTWERFAFESPERNPDYKYEWLFSCVDNNVARHSIQRFWPRYIFGGSTVNMTAKVTLYELGSEFECMMCYNQPEKNPESPEEIRVALLQKDEVEVRRLSQKAGADLTLVMNYLHSPTCGSLGESEIRKFQTTVIEPSVGFASVGAGIMLVARFLRCLMQGTNVGFPRYPNEFFSFMNLSSGSFPTLAKPECECRTRLGEID